MARKMVSSRASSRTQAQKSVKKTTARPVQPKRPVSPAAAPAKTVKRAAPPDKKPAVDQKKVAAEKKPAADSVPGKGKPELGKKKGVAAVKTSAGPAAAKVVKPKVKKPRAKKAPPRMRVRWCVYDGMMKPVALFDYNQRKEAEASLAQYLQKKPTYFLQTVKEPMPLPPEAPEAS